MFSHVVMDFILSVLPLNLYFIVKPEAILSDVHKRISDAFDVFDHEFNKTVDVR